MFYVLVALFLVGGGFIAWVAVTGRLDSSRACPLHPRLRVAMGVGGVLMIVTGLAALLRS